MPLSDYINKQGVSSGGFGGFSNFVNEIQTGKPLSETTSWNTQSTAKPTFFQRAMNVLSRPISLTTSVAEDTAKLIGYGIGNVIKPKMSWGELGKQYAGAIGRDIKGSITGKRLRFPSEVASDVAEDENNKILKYGIKTIGYGGDFLLDPLNKLKLLALTKNGIKAEKAGKLGLSVAEQGAKGERALIQFGKAKLAAPTILAGLTKANDAIRKTKIGTGAVKALSAISSKVRPAGVNREEWKVITDAITTAKNTIHQSQETAIQFGTQIGKIMRERKVTQFEASQLLHAIEKGDEKLLKGVHGLEDVWAMAMGFKKTNEVLWKQLGGDILENYGLTHTATDKVIEAARQQAISKTAFKMFSTDTPLDIHRQWVKLVNDIPIETGAKPTMEITEGFPSVTSKIGDVSQPLQEGVKAELPKVKTETQIVNLKEQGIKYIKDLFEENKGGFVDKSGKIVKVEQATAQEINNFLDTVGKEGIFREDLPTVVAKMGVSTGRKQAGVEFLNEVKRMGKLSEGGQKLVNQTYEKMTNIESINKAIKGFDKIQNAWKAQALLAPAYHVRNIAGNLWNNFLANINPLDYGSAAKVQKNMKTRKLSEAETKLVAEMKKHNIIGGGWYGADIPQAIENEISKGNWNPLSQKFKGYRLNRATGEIIENNARIAHYLTKRKAGYTAEQAAKSVKRFLFDYTDLTWAEQNILKRVMPFYTWTSKNVPLQFAEFFKQPGKFSKVAIGKRDIEAIGDQPNEKWMSDYLTGNSPMKLQKDKEGNYQYLLLGQWLPFTQAMDILSQPTENLLGMLSPILKLPAETILNKSSFFKDTLGDYEKLERYQGETQNYLGLDLRKKTVNVLRSIRALNELDKLNPGQIWGSTSKESIFRKLGLKEGSAYRGGRYSDDPALSSRILGLFVGKTPTYKPSQAKFYYDKDTDERVSDYKFRIKQAQIKKQPEEVKKLTKELQEFLKERK